MPAETPLKVGELVLVAPEHSSDRARLAVVCEVPEKPHPSGWVARVSDTGDVDVWGWSSWVDDDQVTVVTDFEAIPVGTLYTSIGLGGTSHAPALLAEARRRREVLTRGQKEEPDA